jgi:hypothetical protein
VENKNKEIITTCSKCKKPLILKLDVSQKSASALCHCGFFNIEKIEEESNIFLTYPDPRYN